MKTSHFQFSLVTLALSVCLSVAPHCRGQQAEPPLSIEALNAQVGIAEQLHALELSGEQIAQLRKFAERVAEPHRKLRAARERAELRAALIKARDAALAGKSEPHDGLPTVMEVFQAEWKQLEEARDEAVKSAAEESAKSLKPAQLALLVNGPAGSAGEVIGQIADHRGAEPPAWREWRDEACRKLAQEAAGSGDAEPPAESVKSLVTLFNTMRNMPTDDFFSNRERLGREMQAALAQIVSQSLTEERRESALKTLSVWYETDGFAELLKRLAELKK